GRYDTLTKIVENLSARDSALYVAIYESDPYSAKNDLAMDRKEFRDSLNKLTNQELTELFNSGLAKTENGVREVGQVVDTMVHIALSGVEKVNHIPSIQPINNPRLHLLATSFGMRINPFYKTLQMHSGVDYSVPEGTAVFATADGVVSQIQTKGHNNGLSVTINHLNGYTTSYSFLSRTYVKVGSWLRRGDLIAFTGNTGMSYGPHLHYQVMFKGEPVDPLGYMFLELDAYQLKDLEDIASHAMQSLE
ncbi:MAG: M23 family metallopeptidase, partial [Rikenellaceae bacterium]